MTASSGIGTPTSPADIRSVLILAAAHTIPVLAPSLFGWLFGVMAVPAAWIILSSQEENGRTRVITYGLAGAALPAMLTGRLALYAFTLTFLPLAGVMAQGARNRENPVLTGSRGAIWLGCGWLVYWFFFGVWHDFNPYQELIRMFDQGFADAGRMYIESGQLDAETQARLLTVIEGLRTLFPRILPGLLACCLLVTAWMNMVVFSGLQRRFLPDGSLWPPYRNWRLPESLVWLVILSGIGLLTGTAGIKDAGLNGLLVGMTLYCFQGIAVLVHLMDHWQMPRYLRLALWILLLLQSYGLVLIGILGLADIWFSLRPGSGKRRSDKS